MTELSLFPLYKGWDTYQDLLVKAIQPLTAEQLTLQPAPGIRPIWMNVAHIIGARAGWMHYVLGRGGEELKEISQWDWPGQPARSADELVSGLETTWQAIQEMLSSWTTADLDVQVRDVDDNGQEHWYSRQWVIWHLIEHDLHHGGEISFMLGTHGLPSVDI